MDPCWRRSVPAVDRRPEEMYASQMLLLLWAACQSPSTVPPETDTGPLDLREDYPEPEGDGLQMRTPDLLVPAYSEKLFCYYGTWEGPDTAVDELYSYQVMPYNHHNQVKLAPENSPPDGTLEECTPEELSGAQPFVDGVPPFDIPGGSYFPQTSDQQNLMLLPEGYAVKLTHGRRWVIDTHYVNTTDRDVIVNSAISLGFADPSTITNWVGVIQLDSNPPQITPGDYRFSFDCAWPKDMQILVISSHMHARGRSFSVDYLHGDQSDRVHEVPNWSDDYRVYPKMDSWQPGEFPIQEGEALRTTCAWYNETDHLISFPDEMCTTLVVASPLDGPIGCYDGEWR